VIVVTTVVIPDAFSSIAPSLAPTDPVPSSRLRIDDSIRSRSRRPSPARPAVSAAAASTRSIALFSPSAVAAISRLDAAISVTDAPNPDDASA